MGEVGVPVPQRCQLRILYYLKQLRLYVIISHSSFCVLYYLQELIKEVFMSALVSCEVAAGPEEMQLLPCEDKSWKMLSVMEEQTIVAWWVGLGVVC